MANESWTPTKRSRKSVERFVAEPASYRTAGDFVKPDKVQTPAKSTGKKRGRKPRNEEAPIHSQPPDNDLERLKCPPEDMVGKRIKVFWECVQQYYYGKVDSHTPSLQHLAFNIVYDDDDMEDGMLYEGVFVNEEDIRRPYQVLSGHTTQEKPTAAQETPTAPKPALELQPAVQQKRAAVPESALARESAAVQKPAERAGSQPKPAPAQQPAAGRRPAEHAAVPEAKDAAARQQPAIAHRPAALPAPVSLPSRKPAPQEVPKPPPMTAEVFAKFNQNLQKAMSATAQPSTPVHLGSESKQPGVVMGIPVPGQSKAAGGAIPQVGRGLGPPLRPSPPVRKSPTSLETYIPDWGAKPATLRASKTPQRSAVLPQPRFASAAPASREPSQPVASAPPQPVRNGESASGAAMQRAQPAVPQSPKQPAPQTGQAQQCGADQPVAAPAEAPPKRLPDDTAAASPANAAKKEAVVGAAGDAAPAVVLAATEAPAKRKRGRPPKPKDVTVEETPPPAKKPRGRPRKTDVEKAQHQNGAAVDTKSQAQDVGQPAAMHPGDVPPAAKAVAASAPEDNRESKNGHGLLGADADAHPAPRPTHQQQDGGAAEAPPAPANAAAEPVRPAVMNTSGTSNPAEIHQRLLTGGHASTSSPGPCFDARAAAQPVRRAGSAFVSRGASSAPSKLGPVAALPKGPSAAAQAEPSPARLPSSQPAQEDLAATHVGGKHDPWLGSPSVPGIQEGRLQQVSENGGALASPVLSSPGVSGQQSAKAGAHPQVTKLVTMLPSRLSPAYTPTLKPPSRTPPQRSSAQRSSFGAAASPALQRADSDGKVPEGTPTQESKEEQEIAKRRKGQDSIMKKVEHAVKGLTRTKESIKAATVLAAQAAQRGAAPRVIRYLIERIDKESAGPKRVDILYLADSVLQNCRNPKCAGCGPDSAPAQAYPRVIAAALPALIKAVSEDFEGARKADKVLSLWAKREMLPLAALQPEIDRLKERLAQHDSAASAKAAARSLQKQVSDAANNSSATAVRIGSETGGGALMELKQEEDDDWDDDEAAPLPTLPQAQEEQRPPWQRTGGTDVGMGTEPGSPEGSPWHQGVSPASSGYAPWSPSLSSGGQQTTPQHVPAALAAPWHQPAAAPSHGHVGSAPGQTLQHSGYTAAGVPAPRPPPHSWPAANTPQHAQPPPPAQPRVPLQQPAPAAAPSNGHAAPQQIAWEPEEAWDSDADVVVPPGLADVPPPQSGGAKGNTWRPRSLERVSSPGLYQQNKGNAAGPSRLAATEPAHLLDEFDDLYSGLVQQQPQQAAGFAAPVLPPPPPPLKNQFPALLPLAPTPPAQAFAPPPYGVAAQQDEAPPPLPADEPPPLPPPEDEDDDNFQPPLPAGPPPPTPPPPEAAAGRHGAIMDVEMQDALPPAPSLPKTRP